MSRPMPRPTPLTRPFWTAARDGVLTMQRCDDCASWIWTPYPACTTCASERLTWTPVSGRGSLYSYSVVHRPQTSAFESGYVVGIVELDEGPRMLTRLVDAASDGFTVGMRLEVVFEPVDDDLALYPFRPAKVDQQ